MTYEKPMVAVLLGGLSTIAYEIFTRIALLLGFGKYSLYQLDSLIITMNRPVDFIGFFVSFTVGGLVAAIFYFSLKKIGTDYLIVKAIFFTGLLIWVLLEVVFLAIEGREIPLRPIEGYIVHMFGALIFGLTVGLLFKKYLVKEDKVEI